MQSTSVIAVKTDYAMLGNDSGGGRRVSEEEWPPRRIGENVLVGGEYEEERV